MARDISKLHPELQELVTKLQNECFKKGLKIGIGECVRTVEEQDALYAQGRITSGNKVTNARGSTYSSMHQWGIAFDFYRNDGKGAYNDSDGFFTKVGKIGQSLGLEWGGSWKTPVDKPHFQLPDWGSTPNRLKSLYRTPDYFIKSWLAKPINTVTKTSPTGEIKWLQTRLNELLTTGVPLSVDGDYGKKTIQAVLNYWKQLDWNKEGKDDGTRAGAKTIAALSTGRVK